MFLRQKLKPLPTNLCLDRAANVIKGPDKLELFFNYQREKMSLGCVAM